MRHRLLISDKQRSILTNACKMTIDNPDTDTPGMEFSSSAVDFIIRRDWKVDEVLTSIHKHLKSGYNVYIKPYNTPHARPRFGYDCSLCHGIDIQQALKDLTLTVYLEMKGRTLPTEIPFQIRIHQHSTGYKSAILPILPS